MLAEITCLLLVLINFLKFLLKEIRHQIYILLFSYSQFKIEFK